MSILEAVKAHQFVPPAGAIDDYKRSVREGREDPATLDAVRRLPHEWKRDRAVYVARVENRRRLDEDVPKLEAAAQQTHDAAQRASAFASSAIPDEMTLADLRSRLRENGLDVPLDTPAHLGQILLAVASHAGSVKEKALDAASRVNEVRQAAKFALYSTGDRIIHQQIDALRARVANLETRISERTPILNIDRRIEVCKRQCEDLAAGKRPWDGNLHAPGTGLPEPPTIETLYRRKRAELDELLGQASEKDAAVAANEADREAIEQLQRQIRERTEALLEVENMRWDTD